VNYIPSGSREQAVIDAAERRQNEERLRCCAGPHKFVSEVARRDPRPVDAPRIVDSRTPPGPPRQVLAPTGMLRCQLCQGRATAEQVEWYATGVIHGRDIEPPHRRRPAPLAFDEGLGSKKGIV